MITCPVTGTNLERAADHPVLSYGFRPFFLLAGLYAAIAVPLWLLLWTGVAGFTPSFAPSHWHAHEMLFGFAGAALGGFLLTAGPNWTGHGPVRGYALLILVIAWIAGRVAMAMSGTLNPWVVLAADGVFFPLLAAFQAPGIIVRSAWRNGVFVVILTALTVANLGMHLEAAGVVEGARWGSRVALDVFILAVTVVGGRVVPAFTQGGLKGQGIASAIPAAPRLDLLAILSVASMTLAEAAGAPEAAVGAIAIVAAGANLARLVRWQGNRTLRWPLLWVLHVGMTWLVVGLALKGAAGFSLAPEAMALHALGAGAIGTMILAVMTRATLGHTGRELIAIRGSWAAYLAVTGGALLRVIAPVLPGQEVTLTIAGGSLWSAGFVLFVLLYGRVLLSPRVDGRPG